MGVKSQMITTSLTLTLEQFEEVSGGGSFPNLPKILEDLGTKVRSETDEHTFRLLYEFVQKDTEDLVFETIWALPTGNAEDKLQLESLYHAIIDTYGESLDSFASSLCEDEWDLYHIGDSLVLLITGGMSYSGESPTDAYDKARLLFWSSDDMAYGEWLYDQLNVDAEKFFQQKYSQS